MALCSDESRLSSQVDKTRAFIHKLLTSAILADGEELHTWKTAPIPSWQKKKTFLRYQDTVNLSVLLLPLGYPW